MKASTSPLKAMKLVLVSGVMICGFLWAISNSYSKSTQTDRTKSPKVATEKYKAEDYVGAETCKTCHADKFEIFAQTAHAKLTELQKWTDRTSGCESCHGPGKAHVEGGGDKTKIRTFEDLSDKEVSETCLKCHAGKEEHNNYRRGEHWRNDVRCTNCHSPHSKTATSTKMLVKREPQLCFSCHAEMKAQFSMPFHHKVPEGAMKCSDCHNPHGGFELKQVRLATGGDLPCMKCHADKQGPFVFEHAPSKVEGCVICHTPHGSNNPKLLKRNEVRQLCLECHTNVGTVAPNTPSFHNQATTRFQNCTTCHVKIHGSNLSNVYFR